MSALYYGKSAKDFLGATPVGFSASFVLSSNISILKEERIQITLAGLFYFACCLGCDEFSEIRHAANCMCITNNKE